MAPKMIVSLLKSLLRDDETTIKERFLETLHTKLFWLFLIGGLLVTDHLTHREIFELAATREQDSVMRETAIKRAQFSTETKLVDITDGDFQVLFRGILPLDAHVLTKLICELTRRSPKLLVVDLDTSDQSFKQMRLPRMKTVPIVWARGADEVSLNPQRVLGSPEPPPDQRWGLATYPLAFDLSVREYPRQMRTSVRSSPTLHWVAFCALFPADARCKDQKLAALEVGMEDRFVAFSKFPASEFIDSRTDSEACPAAALDDVRIKNQIIFVGGTYSSGDRFRTPLGDQSGTEIVASGLEAELEAHKMHVLHGWPKYLWKFLIACLIVAIHATFKPIPALAITLVFLGGLVWKGVWLAFQFGYRASSVPFAIGILLEQMTGAAEQAQHLEHQNFQLRSKLRQLTGSQT